MRRYWLLLALLPLLARAGEAPLQLAVGSGAQAELMQLSRSQKLSQGPLPATLQAPLGSLWKLFVYAYLVDNQRTEEPYLCTGQDRDEVYCCNPGERIDREQALVKSCGLYFAPARLDLSADSWTDYWRQRQAPDWLKDLNRLQPQQRVPVSELLAALAQLPGQEQARKVLLDVVLHAADGKAVAALGGRLRAKTWSWLADHDEQARQGGFAGWLVDGTPVWAGGPGTSMALFGSHAEVLGSVLPTPWPKDPGACVEVNLFSRYPVREVRTPNAQPAAPGVLQGHYDVEFSNGNRLGIESTGELFLERSASALQLTARLSREEYVARVLDREAMAQPVEAARALAVTIRTYLLQSAERRGDCLAITDSSASQRVAPRPATADAREVAAWTEDLVLAGSAVNYHTSMPGPDRLAWTQAVEQARSGLRYDSILLRAFPRASLSRWDKPVAACQPLPAAQTWLQAQQRRWRPTLDAEPGYSEARDFSVCQLASGKPYVDRERRRIFVRGLFSLQDRLDLTHEYLHLAFEAHPNGQDEVFVESLARHLLLELTP